MKLVQVSSQPTDDPVTFRFLERLGKFERSPARLHLNPAGRGTFRIVLVAFAKAEHFVQGYLLPSAKAQQA